MESWSFSEIDFSEYYSIISLLRWLEGEVQDGRSFETSRHGKTMENR